jgi:hypothetical protein
MQKQLQRAQDLEVAFQWTNTVYVYMNRLKEHRRDVWQELSLEKWHNHEGKFDQPDYSDQILEFVARYEAIMNDNTSRDKDYDGKLSKRSAGRAALVRRSIATRRVRASSGTVSHTGRGRGR